MFIAGHETTGESESCNQTKISLILTLIWSATSLSWTLLELARNPEIQDKLRREIRDKKHQIRSAGTRSGFTAEELDSMPYLNAVLKVRLVVYFSPFRPR